MPINIQDNKMMLAQINAASVDLHQEEHRIIFRFNDLSLDAQKRFCQFLVDDSSIYSIRNAKNNEVVDVLQIANPIIIKGGWGGFTTWSNSTLFRWGEKQLSRIVYYTLFRNLGSAQMSTIKRYIETQDLPRVDKCFDCDLEGLPTRGSFHYHTVETDSEGSNSREIFCPACYEIRSETARQSNAGRGYWSPFAYNATGDITGWNASATSAATSKTPKLTLKTCLQLLYARTARKK